MSKQVFQVGDRAESKSIIKGFRGAWFRCEVKEVVWIKGLLKYRVKYYDYDDDDGEELLNLHHRHSKGKRQLMMRPPFPPIYTECELLSMGIDGVKEIAVVVDGCWRVGDKADWWKDNCYWSGIVTNVLDDGNVKIELLPEPLGEGGAYTVSCRDLRPSLDWSPNSGWKFAGSVESQNGHSPARLIQPVKQALPPKSLVNQVDEIDQYAVATPRSSLGCSDSISSHASECSLPLQSKLIHSKASAKVGEKNSGEERKRIHEENMDSDTEGNKGKRSCSDSVSSSYVGATKVEVPLAISAEKQDSENQSANKKRLYEAIPLNIRAFDSSEAAITDLEELVCRIRWLKQILKPDGPSTSVNKKWGVVEHPSPSNTKICIQM